MTKREGRITYEELIRVLEAKYESEKEKPGLPHFNNSNKIGRILAEVRRAVWRKSPAPAELITIIRGQFATMEIPINLD